MREQTVSYIPLIWYGGDTLPLIEDFLYTDTAKTQSLNLLNTSASLWLFVYDSNIDFDAPAVSGHAIISGFTSAGAVTYTFTSAQTVTLSSQTTSLFRGFWQIDYPSTNDKLRIRIDTPFKFIQVT